MCRQQDPPLENCSLVDSDLCPNPHYLLQDTNVIFYQIDCLSDPAVATVIILQVVLQEVSGHLLCVDPPVFNYILQVIKT